MSGNNTAITELVVRANQSSTEHRNPGGNHPLTMQRPHALTPQFQQPADREEYFSFLRRSIARNPRDLLSHSQRILLSHQQHQKAQCFAALLDLFIATGENATDLKRSLLSQVRTTLDRDEFLFLLRHLDEGLPVANLTVDSPDSVLSHGFYRGTTDLVIRMDIDDEDISLLEQAYGFLQHNNVEKARKCLEQALNDDPGDPLVSMELLAIYKRLQLREAFYKTYTELSGRKLAFPELWQQLDNRFTHSPQPANAE